MKDKYIRLDNTLKKLKTAQIPNTSTTTTYINFYPRVVNNTNIIFTDDELALLNKGLKYNLHHKHKNWITTLAFEAKTAITLLPISEQEPIRYHIANNIRKLYIQNANHKLQQNTQAKHERKTTQPNKGKTNIQ